MIGERVGDGWGWVGGFYGWGWGDGDEGWGVDGWGLEAGKGMEGGWVGEPRGYKGVKGRVDGKGEGRREGSDKGEGSR